MPRLNTLTVTSVMAPTIVGTAFSHFLDPKPLENTPKASLSYHQGIELMKRFLVHASHHPVEHLQAFTAKYVPHPIWVHTEDATIPSEFLEASARHVIDQLGPGGSEKVGGSKWWRWRPKELTAEWIEMRKGYWRRSANPQMLPRTMFYVHGGSLSLTPGLLVAGGYGLTRGCVDAIGGYFFGSVDAHRYQLQRHARKLEARVFAPIYDVLACYLYLISQQPPETVILAGDSAGGGMVLSILVILRDRGIPMPAGAVLISPWVDLCHSFPSIVADDGHDFMPPSGFFHAPSAAWPPPPATDGTEVTSPTPVPTGVKAAGATPYTKPATSKPASAPQGCTITIDGHPIALRDQIHLYTTNSLMDHPLVSPVLQSSLGGLPPLLILVGGGEILRDEQIYIAHKAANPAKYPTWAGHLAKHGQEDCADKFPPTKVWLQVYDGCCHVTPTLSFTLPAKLMYRAAAHFSAWALTNATHTKIEVDEDDDISVIFSPTCHEKAPPGHELKQTGTIMESSSNNVPPFKDYMIRQQIDPQGRIFELPPESRFPALQTPPEQIGVIKEGPVRRWLAAKRKWDSRFSKAKKEVDKKRAKEVKLMKGTAGDGDGDGERPPPTALYGRVKREKVGEAAAAGGVGKESIGLRFWSLMGYCHDEKTMAREEKAEAAAERAGEEVVHVKYQNNGKKD